MKLFSRGSRRDASQRTAFIAFCLLGAGIMAAMFIPSAAHGSAAAAQSTATVVAPETEVPTSFLDAVLIPDAALSRFDGIAQGLGKLSSSTLLFPYLGNPDAPIKIVQLSSYSCAACQDYYQRVTLYLLPAIRAGQVQFTLIPVTLTGEYDPTNEAAAALCALDQDAFWPMTDVLFTWKSRYEEAASDPRRLELAAVKLGLNLDKFNACLLGQPVNQRITANNQYFSRLKLLYTPSILVNGRLVNPSPSLNQLYRLINQIEPASLATAEQPTPEVTATVVSLIP